MINSAHDLGDGGLAVSLSECSIASGLGVTIKIPTNAPRLDRLLFAEGGARVLISCSDQQAVDLKEHYKEISLNQSNNFSISHLGIVNDKSKLSIYQSNNLLIDVNILEIEEIYKNAIYNQISK